MKRRTLLSLTILVILLSFIIGVQALTSVTLPQTTVVPKSTVYTTPLPTQTTTTVPTTISTTVPITTSTTMPPTTTTPPPPITTSAPACSGTCAANQISLQCKEQVEDCICCCKSCISKESASKKSGLDSEGKKEVMKDLSKNDIVSGTKFPYRNDGVNLHPGIDYRCKTGESIFSPFCGTVTKSYSSSSYGNTIIIKACTGEQVLFAHLNKRSVKTGDSVEAGQKIGECGSTGRSEGPHLHIEAWTKDCYLGMSKEEKIKKGCALSWEDKRQT